MENNVQIFSLHVAAKAQTAEENSSDFLTHCGHPRSTDD